MNSKASVFFKVLINRFHPGISPSFFKNLPQDEVKQVFSEITASQDTSFVFTWPDALISKTHYSWLIDPIQKLPKDIKGFVINALPETQAKGIKKLLKIEEPEIPLTPNVKAFLLNRLYQEWNPEDALLQEYLPHSNLDDLFKLSKKELIDLIDLIAMYDLSEAIRHIVDKKSLKAIYLCLTPQRQQFLRLCLHNKEKLAAPKLDISKWDGSQNKLNEILHRRGMLRFGKALCGQSPQFLWNIVHTFDIGRGKTISEHYQKESIPGVTPILVQQVISVINFLKSKDGA
jgi:hypothetical protein